MEELYLILGCFGRRDSVDTLPEFVSCSGIENRILKISEVLEKYDEIMDYFESVRLFDKPMFDINAVRHFIYNMQERYDQRFKRLWTEKQYGLYERFILAHKSCGVYIKLVTINADYEPQTVENRLPEKILVKGDKTPPADPQKFRVIRGRKM